MDKTRTLSSLLTLFESPEALCLARIDDLVDQGLAVEMAAQVAAGPDHRLRQRIDMDLAWLDEPNHHLLVPHNNLFPPLLREIHDPPPLLFVDGHVELLQGDQFAIVGSRRNSLSGRKVAMQLAADLSRAGLTITSGLALGIDAAAHMGALEAEGCTIAVMGTGCDMDYPATNAALAQRIRKSGVIVSEFPLGTHAFPHY
ncbi:MAG: DNA-processing protein DprA, partial [Pseudohongiellaceae bacterium]